MRRFVFVLVLSIAALALLPAVAAPAIAAPAGDRIEVRDGRAALLVSGERFVLAPTLVVIEDSRGRAAPPSSAGLASRTPFRWRPDPRVCPDPAEPCAAAIGEATTADGALSVTVHLSRPSADDPPTFAVLAVWRRRAWVHLAEVELDFAANGMSVIGRDLRPVATHLAYLGRFDPKWVTLARLGRPALTVSADDTVDGLAAQLAPGRALLRLELTAAAARPFRHDARCTREWRLPNRQLSLTARLRIPDERLEARLVFLPGAELSVAKSRWPDGRRAALVITDHADQTSARTLAVLTDALERHHLVITKALFAHGADRPQLEDPEVVALADRLHKDGSEVVPHSATPRRDDRQVTSAALDRFERWHARTWIDHQPETNCEAFGDEGYHVGGRFGISDLLAAHAYSYVWAEDDAPAGDFNLLKPRRLGARAPTVWPIGRLELGGPDSLWMFRTGWDFVSAAEFFKLYAPAQLDRLEAERGLHIAHTYLETYHPKHTRFGARDLFVPASAAGEQPGGAGPVKLDPRFEKILADLDERQARGSLWVPTLAELADRLRATAKVKMTPQAGGAIALESPKRLIGATFVVGRPGVQVTADGRPPRGITTDGNQTIFWLDLPAGKTRLQLRDSDGKPLP
ncbi:MAG TPA: hypothetical protein VII38_12675 [Polyangia bacterium]